MARDRASRPEARPLRLFVAVDVPQAVKERVAAAVEPFRESVPGARWIRPESWHVTMKFLGSVWPRLVDWVHSEVEAAAAEIEPFTTKVTAAGAFPSPRRARVLWAGLADDGGRFVALAAALDGRLEREFPPEKRPFTPHLTLARIKEQAAVPERVLAAEVESEEFPVNRLVLYRSYLQRPAARYEGLARFDLGEPPAAGSLQRPRS